jgi:thiamine biosynthesis lipoprotein
VILALLLAVAATEPVREVRPALGTTAEVLVVGVADAAPALRSAWAALQELEESLSPEKPQNELARLNARGGGTASQALRTLIAHALEVAAASHGAFDPTVAPLLLASAGPPGHPRHLGDGERRALLQRVGAARVKLDPATGALQLRPGTALDLSGVARGFAADRAVEALQAAGVRSGLVSVGYGSMRAFGAPLTVEVRGPVSEVPPWAHFELGAMALGRCGGDQDDLLVLDPRTGEAPRKVLGATVVAASAMEATALAMALYVLGPEEGFELLKQRGAAGFVLIRERGRSIVRATRGFTQSYDLEPAPGILVREERDPTP